MSPSAGPHGPRALLRRLREVMASTRSAQERLDEVVRIIAANMVAEVCSIYLMRAGEMLELFATQGLNPDAVHRTRLRVGEGLVGTIAAQSRPLNLSDAQGHPDFAYRPETGEEVYHSLLGVPVQRDGRVIGVLVVQNRTRRHYDDEEVEALQTTAMVLAELVGAAGLVGRDELYTLGGNATLAQRVEGAAMAPGLGIGAAVLHQPYVAIRRVVAEDPAVERERLREAAVALRQSVDRMLEAHGGSGGGEHVDVLEAYRMFAADRGWFARIGEAIDAGLTAEAAVRRVQEDNRARMNQAKDAILRERLLDLDDLANRLQLTLSGAPQRASDDELPEAFVLVARSIGPAELLDYPHERLRGVVLEEGSPTSHVAVVARSLDIPLIGQTAGVLGMVAGGDMIIVDGDNANVYLRPTDDVLQQFEDDVRASAARRAAYAALRTEPAVTLDGVTVSLNVNAGMPMEHIDLDASGADGIGLFRTELSFMTGAGMPSVAAQADVYGRVLDQVKGRPVVFRTLDIGSDKRLPNFDHGDEENPAIGWRSLRLTLDRPVLMRHQLRALLRAAAGRQLSIMFPMVAEVAEFDAARALLDLECARAGDRGDALPSDIRVGTMLEVPAIAWQLTALLRRVDFLSIGSNDLMQFMFASDRGNPKLIDRYDPLSPGMLAFLHSLAERCAAARADLALCGEIAGRPLEAMALIGLGLRSLSMSPTSIGPVKTMLRSLAVAPLREYLNTLYDLPDHSLRDRLYSYAKDHGVFI